MLTGALCPVFLWENKILGGIVISKFKTTSDELVNDAIRFKEVLVIDSNGDQLGVLSRMEALKKASDQNLDLVCVAPNAKTPVCKIIDYSKFKFESQKKAREARKNQKVQELKEIRLSPVIDKHDMETKAKNCIKFLEKGDKVKVTMRFRGRQMSHVDLGKKIMESFVEMMPDTVVAEKAAKLEGNNLFLILAPKKK